VVELLEPTAIETWLDVGSATGRFALEVINRLPHLRDLHLVEKSPRQVAFARAILVEGWDDSFEFLKVGKATLLVGRATLQSRGPALDESSRRAVAIFEGTLGEVDLPLPQYDVVSCLNVIDRVLDPWRFVDVLLAAVKPNGHLLICDPLDWETNDESVLQGLPDELEAFFARPDCKVVAHTEVLYPFRRSERRVANYVTRTLLIKKTGE
jgi:SAM-dependent methyltransferase